MCIRKTHSGFHDLVWFWYFWEYKYGSIFWLEDGNLYLRLWTMSHTIYAAKFEQTIIHQHVHLRQEIQSHAPAHVLMRLYPIDKSLVWLQSERRTSCYNCWLPPAMFICKLCDWLMDYHVCHCLVCLMNYQSCDLWASYHTCQSITCRVIAWWTDRRIIYWWSAMCVLISD
jgi:hypothetical protein